MPLVLTEVLLVVVVHLGDLYPNGPAGPFVSFVPFGRVRHVQPNYVDGRVTGTQGGKAITLIPAGRDKPLTFTAYGPLARGGFYPGTESSEAKGYLIGDVEIGDTVELRTVRVGDNERVLTVQIVERPNGKIPPSRIKLYPDGKRYHEVNQAILDHKKFGTPLPEHLRPKTGPILPPPDK